MQEDGKAVAAMVQLQAMLVKQAEEEQAQREAFEAKGQFAAAERRARVQFDGLVG